MNADQEGMGIIDLTGNELQAELASLAIDGINREDGSKTVMALFTIFFPIRSHGSPINW